MKIPLRLLDWKKVKKSGRGYTKRELTVVSLMAKLFDSSGISSLLNVGFHDYQDRRNRWWIDICRANDINWHILEIHGPNCERFKEVAPENDHHRIVQGDITKVDHAYEEQFDVLLHWHGPEHVLKDPYLHALPAIEAKAKKMVILGCPDGYQEQGAAYENSHEEHVSFWSEGEFASLGYNTMIVNDKPPGHITAYKRRDDA